MLELSLIFRGWAHINAFRVKVVVSHTRLLLSSVAASALRCELWNGIWIHWGQSLWRKQDAKVCKSRASTANPNACLAVSTGFCSLCSVVQLQGLACRFCWELEVFSQDNCLRLPKGCGLKNSITIVRLSLYACGVGGNKCPALL